MSQRKPVLSSLNRRRFLQYSGSLVCGSSLLAACAGTGTGTAPANSNTSLPQLTQWYHQYGEDGTQQAVMRYAKDYKQANVKVSWVPGTGDDYPNKVRTTLLGTGAPDVFELPSLSVDQVKAGLLASLDDIIADVKSDFNPASLKPFTVDGKVYGIKMINDPTFVYYRKSLFQQANLQPPKTIDDLIAASKAVAKGPMKGIYVGSDGGVQALRYIVGWSAGQGSDFMSDDNKIVFNTARMAAAYSKLHDLNTQGNVLADAPTFWWDSSSFQQGLCAMQFCGLWAMPLIQKSAIGDDFGIFAWPGLDAQSDPATVNGGWAEMVNGKSKNLQAAKDYVKSLWITNAQVQTDWNVAYGFHVPPRISTSATTTKLKSGTAAEAVDLLNKYGHATPPTWNTTMETYLTDAVSTIVKNGGDALSILNAAADKCKTELQKILS